VEAVDMKHTRLVLLGFLALGACLENSPPTHRAASVWPPEPRPSPPLDPVFAAGLCKLDTPEVASLCADQARCPIRKAVRVNCSPVKQFDLAVSREGRAVVAILAVHEQAFVLEAGLDVASTLRHLGSAERVQAAVELQRSEVGDGVLLWSLPSALTLARRGRARWETRSLAALDGTPVDFALQSEDAGWVLLSRGQRFGSELWLASTSSAAAPPVLVGSGGWLSDPTLVIDPSSGEPVVFYVHPEPGQSRLRQWTRAGASDVAVIRAMGSMSVSTTLASDGARAALFNDRGSLRLVRGSGTTDVLAVPPLTVPICSGRSAVIHPEPCPSNPSNVGELAEHASARHAIAAGNGTLWSAEITGKLTVGCRWSRTCYENDLCECRLQSFQNAELSNLRLRNLDAPGRELVLPGRDWWDYSNAPVALAAADDGLLYLASIKTGSLYLIVLDPSAF
jgi:hypothetical protein